MSRYRIDAALCRPGRPVPVNDMWIAAAAIDCGGHLVTFDSDFQFVSGLTVTIFDA